MPVEYEKVRDACIAKKEKDSVKPATEKQIKACKAMAAAWYFKKFGTPVNKVKENANQNYLFELASLDNSELKNNLDIILADNAGELVQIDNKLNVEISFAEDYLNFTQPYSKEDAGYMSYPEIESNIPGYANPTEPTEEELQKNSDYWKNKPSCSSCVHFVPNLSAQIKNEDNIFETHLCHLVKGVIDDLGNCDYHANSLIKVEKTDESMARYKGNERNRNGQN